MILLSPSHLFFGYSWDLEYGRTMWQDRRRLPCRKMSKNSEGRAGASGNQSYIINLGEADYAVCHTGDGGKGRGHRKAP